MKATKSVFGILTIAAALAVQVHAQNWLTNGLRMTGGCSTEAVLLPFPILKLSARQDLMVRSLPRPCTGGRSRLNGHGGEPVVSHD